jgi:hypothetical protein
MIAEVSHVLFSAESIAVSSIENSVFLCRFDQHLVFCLCYF